MPDPKNLDDVAIVRDGWAGFVEGADDANNALRKQLEDNVKYAAAQMTARLGKLATLLDADRFDDDETDEVMAEIAKWESEIQNRLQARKDFELGNPDYAQRRAEPKTATGAWMAHVQKVAREEAERVNKEKGEPTVPISQVAALVRAEVKKQTAVIPASEDKKDGDEEVDFFKNEITPPDGKVN